MNRLLTVVCVIIIFFSIFSINRNWHKATILDQENPPFFLHRNIYICEGKCPVCKTQVTKQYNIESSLPAMQIQGEIGIYNYVCEKCLNVFALKVKRVETKDNDTK